MGLPPVAMKAFSNRISSPPAIFAVLAAGSSASTGAPRTRSIRLSMYIRSGSRRSFSSSFSPRRNSLDKGGRLYGAAGSSPTSVMEASGSLSRSCLAARLEARPAPMRRCLVDFIGPPGCRVLSTDYTDGGRLKLKAPGDPQIAQIAQIEKG